MASLSVFIHNNLILDKLIETLIPGCQSCDCQRQRFTDEGRQGGFQQQQGQILNFYFNNVLSIYLAADEAGEGRAGPVRVRRQHLPGGRQGRGLRPTQTRQIYRPHHTQVR